MTEKMLKKLESGREYRNMVLEVRDADTDTEKENYIVEGYATTFNEAYTLWEWDDMRLDEIVDARAFDNCDMTDVIMQYDHEGRVFARISNETLSLEIDEHGLKVRANLGGTELGRQLFEEIKGGYTTKMSFGFIVAGDREEREKIDGKDVYTRTITDISKLFDVSAVSLPANDATEISSRNYASGVHDVVSAERRKAEKEKAKLKLKTKLLLEV